MENNSPSFIDSEPNIHPCPECGEPLDLDKDGWFCPECGWDEKEEEDE